MRNWNDSDEVEEAFEETVVDCYGDDEQASGVLTMAQQDPRLIKD